MSTADSMARAPCKAGIRRDGWTAERQLCFLDALDRTRSVAAAAAAAGMSRESAYRLRARREGALFGALWDRIFSPPLPGLAESHIGELSDGSVARLLGTHFCRQRGDFVRLAQSAPAGRKAHRTGPS